MGVDVDVDGVDVDVGVGMVDVPRPDQLRPVATFLPRPAGTVVAAVAPSVLLQPLPQPQPQPQRACRSEAAA